ncbi:hypothetical protein BDN72DRAFT_865381 [Pluteus cervinus]|uniref:Uncharacterized protein n=1 Tax=Pluteus cervinus TaxID=181527 RepID=A0ACD3A2S9_9AGAR|nr:hypothetical protein BDN72DRAFT_865381 [Pluteus cervinus]
MPLVNVFVGLSECDEAFNELRYFPVSCQPTLIGFRQRNLFHLGILHLRRSLGFHNSRIKPNIQAIIASFVESDFFGSQIIQTQLKFRPRQYISAFGQVYPNTLLGVNEKAVDFQLRIQPYNGFVKDILQYRLHEPQVRGQGQQMNLLFHTTKGIRKFCAKK